MSLSEQNLDSVQGGGRDFRTTHWSVVLRAGQGHSPQSAEALEKLCGAYWYPLYAFVRRQGHGPEAAQDLTQEFFSNLLANGALQAADPAKGRFRSYLLALLKRMLISEWRHEHRQKRGGGTTIFSLEQDAEDRYRLEPAAAETPETLFERRWAETVLARVLRRLEQEYRDHALGFANLEPYLVEDRGAAPFAEAAARLGMTESALKAVVYRLRCRYGELFREEIAQTVERPEEIEEEIRHLLAILAGD